MNWFERYGVVGAYFLIVISIFLIINQYFAQVDFEKNGTAIIALFSFSILPVGYILAILSQLLYYYGLNGTKIHEEIVRSLPDDSKKKLELSEFDNEQNIEAKMTAKFRLAENPGQLKNLNDFCTKRWDVIAVNAAMRLATIFLIILEIIIKYYKNKNFCFYRIEMFLFGFEIILIFILTKSACVLSKQIIAINVEKALKYK